jgi:hypothetical protein
MYKLGEINKSLDTINAGLAFDHSSEALIKLKTTLTKIQQENDKNDDKDINKIGNIIKINSNNIINKSIKKGFFNNENKKKDGSLQRSPCSNTNCSFDHTNSRIDSRIDSDYCSSSIPSKKELISSMYLSIYLSIFYIIL